MTKGELLDQVHFKVHAGRPSGDHPVHRGLIANLLPAAINYVIVGEYRLRRDERRADLAFGDIHGAVDPEFLGQFELTVEKSAKRGRKFVTLPYKVQSIPHGLGLDEIMPCNGQLVQFHRVRTEVELMALDEDVLGLTTFYWMEQNQQGQRVFFHNLSNMVTDVLVNMVVSANHLEEEDELPLPENVVVQVIDLLFNHFAGIRQLPKDVIADGQ